MGVFFQKNNLHKKRRRDKTPSSPPSPCACYALWQGRGIGSKPANLGDNPQAHAMSGASIDPSEWTELMMTLLCQILGIKKRVVLHEIIMFGISPMTIEFCIARSAPFQRKRLANCNFPRDQWRTCAASSNAASSHTHALAQYDGGARHMQGTVKFLAIFRAAQARYPLAQPPPFTSFNFCFHEIFMKLSSHKKRKKND